MGRQTCDAPPIVLNLITIHAHLVTSDDSLQSVLLTELLGDIGAELHTDTTLARPAAGLLLRIGPEHLHHQARLAGLALVVSVELANIVEGDVVVRE